MTKRDYRPLVKFLKKLDVTKSTYFDPTGTEHILDAMDYMFYSPEEHSEEEVKKLEYKGWADLLRSISKSKL